MISVFELRNYLIISPYVNKTSLQKSINIMAFIFIGIENNSIQTKIVQFNKNDNNITDT